MKHQHCKLEPQCSPVRSPEHKNWKSNLKQDRFLYGSTSPVKAILKEKGGRIQAACPVRACISRLVAPAARHPQGRVWPLPCYWNKWGGEVVQVLHQGRVSHQPQSLLYQTVQPTDVKPHLLHPFPTKRNLKRMEVHESTPYMRSYFGSDVLWSWFLPP